MPFLVEAGRGDYRHNAPRMRKRVQYKSELLASRYAIKATKRRGLTWWTLRSMDNRQKVIRKGLFADQYL